MAHVFIVIGALIVVQFGFGGYSIVLQKFAKNAGVDSLIFSLLRDVLAAPVLFIAAAILERGVWLPRWREIPLMFSLGLLGMFMNQYFYIQGLFYTTPNMASIFQPCIPIFTTAMAFLVCLEPLPSARRLYQIPKVAGVIIGTGGAILLVLTKPQADKYTLTWNQFAPPFDGNCTGTPLSHHGITTGACLAVAQFPASMLLNLSAPYFTLAGGESNFTVKACQSESCDGCTQVGGVQPLGVCNERGLEWTSAKVGALNQTVGLLFLFGNCSAMALYVILQKIFIFRAAARATAAGRSTRGLVARWSARPIALTAYAYSFGALCMAAVAGVRFAIDRDTTVFHVPTATVPGLVYAVLISSSLCYGLISWCNAQLSAVVVTAFWPLQVFVTVVLSYFVLNSELAPLEYAGMALILGGMLTVVAGGYFEQKSRAVEVDHERKPLVN